MEEMAKIITNYGLMAGITVWLLYRSDKRNENRETRYQDTIKELSEIIKDNMKCLETKIDHFIDKFK